MLVFKITIWPITISDSDVFVVVYCVFVVIYSNYGTSETKKVVKSCVQPAVSSLK